MDDRTREVLDFWERVKAETGIEGDFLGAWPFGDNPELADELLSYILEGKKRAGTDLVKEMEFHGDPEPEVGAYCIVLDGAGHPAAVTRTVSIRRTTFNDVDAEHAFWEGEDDQTLKSYRREHIKYFKRLCMTMGFEFSEDMEVVLERFELVYPVDRRAATE
ncbi:MAG: ASCH domain-containing protein [Thermoplasmata archaeon]|nr:ASCH domain-containing protein [Thermoplasmata archaeon]